MSVAQSRWDELQSELLSTYPKSGAKAFESMKAWAEGNIPLVPKASIEELVMHGSLDLLHEGFWRNIPFGTGGIRGKVGFGPNRINPTVVALTIQAHCDFLLSERGPVLSGAAEKTVVVANDVRIYRDLSDTYAFLSTNPLLSALNGEVKAKSKSTDDLGVGSRSLAFLAAEVYAGNGFVCYLRRPNEADEILTTPELSFLIRYLKAGGGVNMSASHNPPDDNGIKVYDELGGQYLPPFDEELAVTASRVTSVTRMDFAEGMDKGLIVDVPESALAEYQEMYRQKCKAQGLYASKKTPIVFTPLSGCGGRTMGAMLVELGYDVTVPPGQGPDGTFKAIPLLAPNPEVPEATGPAKATADKVGADFVVATDPDADRIGVELKHQGEWVHLTGNQIATVLAYYLLLDPEGPKLTGGVYVTLVTTQAVRAIAEEAGVDHVVDDLLVGFKYIGAALQTYEQQLKAETGAETIDDATLLSFAAEESHGYLVTPRMRDKDGMSGGIYLAHLFQREAESGRSVLDYLNRIYAELGEFGDIGRSLLVSGSAGISQIHAVMQELRTGDHREFAGRRVLEEIDHWDEEAFGPISSNTDREARNVLTFVLEDARLTFRPSGTEPKLKFYVQTAQPQGSPQTAQDKATDLSNEVFGSLVEMMGSNLDPYFAALPDVISLEKKLYLQNDVLPTLKDQIVADPSDDDAHSVWLAKQLSSLVPGGSVWSSAAPAFARAAVDWEAPLRSALDEVLATEPERS